MGKISVFNNITVDGFFAGLNGEIDFFKEQPQDPDSQKFFDAAATTGGALIMGRTTYEMMAGYWPTPDAIKAEPGMAGIMNNRRKIVFSRTMKKIEEKPNWKNISLLHEIKPEEIMRLKEQEGKGLTILGSGTIVQQLTDFGLIDGYMLLVNPVVLGEGKPLFKNTKKMNLKLLESRAFKNGTVFLRYEPV
jgi:dihydrofolate reductase